MAETQNQNSEVARLLAQIRSEYEAAQRGLSGVAQGTSKHAFVTKKMENMSKLQADLASIVGHDASLALVIDQLDTCPDVKGMSAQ